MKTVVPSTPVDEAEASKLLQKPLKQNSFFSIRHYEVSVRHASNSEPYCDARVKIEIEGETFLELGEGSNIVGALYFALNRGLSPKYGEKLGGLKAEYAFWGMETCGGESKSTVWVRFSNGKSEQAFASSDRFFQEAALGALVQGFEHALSIA